MVLTKDELKVLKKMEKQPLPQSDIPNFRELYEADFIHDVYTDEVDAIGSPVRSGKYRVTTKYWRYKEEHRWFNTEFVIRSILVPIAVGVLSCVVTRFLIGP